MSSAEKLLPCPFCGSEHVEPRSPGADVWTILCFDCGSEGPPSEGIESVYAAWNTRVPDVARERAAHAAGWLAGRDAAADDAASKTPLRPPERDMQEHIVESIRDLTPPATSALDEMLERARRSEREACARVIDKRAEDYHREVGIYDPSTGVTEYPGNGDELMEEWESLAAAIRAGKGDVG